MTDDIFNSCICMDVRAAARRLTQIYDDALSPSGISVTQFSQLHLIQSIERPTFKNLAEAKELDRTTLTRNMRVLEKAGLVTIEAGADARTREVKLTNKGKQAYIEATPLWMNVQRDRANQLGSAQKKELTQLLETLTGTQTGTMS